MTLIFAGILTVLMAAVVYYDLTRYIIPNWICGGVILLYPAFLLLSPVPIDWQGAGMVFAATIAAGLLIFRFNIMGGGDVKLLMALSLWAGRAAMLDFTMLVAVLGGGLSIALLGGRPIYTGLMAKLPKPWPTPRILTQGADLPYGLAIAAAFLWMLWHGELPGIIL